MALGLLNGIYNIAAEPELKFVGQNSTALVTLRCAANRSRKLEDGSFENLATHWMNLQAWGATAEEIAQAAAKGDKIDFVGSVETQEWADKNTGDKRSKDVVTVKFFKIYKKDGGPQQSVSRASQQNRQASSSGQQQESDPWGSSPSTGSFGSGYDDAPPF